MKKCAIITAYIEGELTELLPDPENYFIIAADGGVGHALRAGIHIDQIIGDFDSYKGELPQDIPIMRVPVEKDDTDSGLSLSYAVERGFREIVIVGGLGGRLDHTVANIQLMCDAAVKGAHVEMRSRGNTASVLRNGAYRLKRRENASFSVFAMTEKCKGVTIENAHYNLDRHELTYSFPLGCSNEFESDEALISVEDGTLLIVVADKR